MSRACIKCGSTANGFHKNPRYADGLHPYCKVCRKVLAALRLKNESPEKREMRLRKAKEYRAAPENKRRQYETAKEWRSNNKDRAIESSRNADRRRFAAKSMYMRMWRQRNKEAVSAYSRNRRSAVRSSEGTHTADDVRQLLAMQQFCCAVCKKKLNQYHVDHVVPLISGGSNDKLNLQVLCPTCNNQKHVADPIDFMQRKGFLL